METDVGKVYNIDSTYKTIFLGTKSRGILSLTWVVRANFPIIYNLLLFFEEISFL